MTARWSEPGYGRIAAIVTRHAGLKIPDYRRHELETAARKEMAEHSVDGVDGYAGLLERDAVALSDLVSDLTVGESYFFRDPGQFALIADRIVPELRASRPEGHLFKLWSAGCAGGEEPYSLAMLLEELALQRRATVLATDISRPALEKARRASYSAWSLRGEARARVAPYVRAAGKRFVVLPRFRERVRFEYLNLAEDAYPSLATGTVAMDLVLCRNVLIYFEPPVVASVASRLFASLAEGGWLLLGPSDPPLGAHAPFEVLTTPAGLVYRRPRSLERRAPALPTRQKAPAAPAPVPAPAPIPEPPLDRARRDYARGDYHAVLAALGEALDTAEAAVLFVRAAANSGDLEAAERAATRVAERFALSAEVHLLRGLLLVELGQDAPAADAVRRALYLDRGLVLGHVTLGAILRRRGDLAGARRAYRNALRLAEAMPAQAPVPMGEGQCAGRLAQLASAQLSLLNPGRD